MSALVDHDTAKRLMTAFCRGRAQSRAAAEFYDRTLLVDDLSNDPASRVAQAARGIYALRAANAINDTQTSKALAALLSAYQAVRSLP